MTTSTVTYWQKYPDLLDLAKDWYLKDNFSGSDIARMIIAELKRRGWEGQLPTRVAVLGKLARNKIYKPVTSTQRSIAGRQGRRQQDRTLQLERPPETSGEHPEQRVLQGILDRQAVEYASRRDWKTLQDLESDDCRFPVGEIKPQAFCGHPAVPGTNTCFVHAPRMVKSTPEALKPAATPSVTRELETAATG